jgi:hypothetical protein
VITFNQLCSYYVPLPKPALTQEEKRKESIRTIEYIFMREERKRMDRFWKNWEGTKILESWWDVDFTPLLEWSKVSDQAT